MVDLDAEGKCVVITGCDSGIGKQTALRLSYLGMRVYALCLTEKGKSDFDRTEGVTAILADVTCEDSIKNAYQAISENTRKIHALINNAGILKPGLLEATSQQDWRSQFEVNVIGMATVTRIFLPAIRRARGRIINISSMTGRIASPGMCAYSSTKFATQGLTDSLRRELKTWGIDVILVEPGTVDTPLWDSVFDVSRIPPMLEKFPIVRDAYGERYFKEYFSNLKSTVSAISSPPSTVVDVLEEAVTTRLPMSRYSTGSDSYLWLFLSYCPSFVSDYLLTCSQPRTL